MTHPKGCLKIVIKFLVIGNDKGKDIDSRAKNNFGMAKPEGYS